MHDFRRPCFLFVVVCRSLSAPDADGSAAPHETHGFLSSSLFSFLPFAIRCHSSAPGADGTAAPRETHDFLSSSPFSFLPSVVVLCRSLSFSRRRRLADRAGRSPAGAAMGRGREGGDAPRACFGDGIDDSIERLLFSASGEDVAAGGGEDAQQRSFFLMRRAGRRRLVCPFE